MPKTGYDILIIGGGIYGCGIAQAVSACGYKTVLIEQNTIASGTSSQSTKLIHGGLRYLEQFNFKLVYEALNERELLLKNAPDLVAREWFYIPVYKHSKRPPLIIWCGLFLYYILSRGRSKFKWVNKETWAEMQPEFNLDNLKAVLAYEDAATDDAALTRAVAKSAQTMGCSIIEEVSLVSAKYEQGCWYVKLSNGEALTSKLLINASGAWVNQVSRWITPQPPTVDVQLVQGSHLMLNRPCSAYIYTESLDGRVMFFRPWKGKTLAGTTETSFVGNPSDIVATQKEVQDILASYNHYFPSSPCQESDIEHVYCGLRVLPVAKGEAFETKRETIILEGGKECQGYIAVYGGKLTTYRREADRVLKRIKSMLKAPKLRSTKEIPLG